MTHITDPALSPSHDGDPFLRHIVLLLSVYELGTKSAPAPVWHGARTLQTDVIIQAIVACACFVSAPPLDVDSPKLDERSSAGVKDRERGESEGGKGIKELFVVNHTFTPLAPVEEDSSSDGLQNDSSSTTKSSLLSSSSAPSGTTFSPSPSSSSSTPKQSNSKSKSDRSSATPTTNRTRSKPSLSLGTLPNLFEMCQLFSSLSGLQPTLAAHAQAVASNGNLNGPTPTPPIHCPFCHRGWGGRSGGLISADSSSMIVPSMGPLAAAVESGTSAVEELKLLKAQVSDVARGVVMVQLKDVVNTMVDGLEQFAKEVMRISQEVGTEGKLGGQASMLDLEGTWGELTGVVNKLAASLTLRVDRTCLGLVDQVRSIVVVTTGGDVED
ncbi:hypothetical protein D9756_009275 [Leucocoprinus leucothites]|uniref:Uncharacterized protein n=1 Tax=Leucocoprinus leucothites TaxID=201217 RepID=A0A8H5CYS8_9AGAR|nr:hypothetical protein D9756_009275 [Leucoagaricus leucothites]